MTGERAAGAPSLGRRDLLRPASGQAEPVRLEDRGLCLCRRDRGIVADHRDAGRPAGRRTGREHRAQWPDCGACRGAVRAAAADRGPEDAGAVLQHAADLPHDFADVVRVLYPGRLRAVQRPDRRRTFHGQAAARRQPSECEHRRHGAGAGRLPRRRDEHLYRRIAERHQHAALVVGPAARWRCSSALRHGDGGGGAVAGRADRRKSGELPPAGRAGRRGGGGRTGGGGLPNGATGKSASARR